MEFVKALHNPYIFFHTLNKLNALEIIFPYIHSILNSIENDSMFKNGLYLKSNTEQKIALSFLDIENINAVSITKELSLTNNQHNILHALTNLHKIASNLLNANDILKLLKECNILRNKNLRREALITYQTYTKILDNSKLASKLNEISDICIKLDNLDIQKHIVGLDKTQIKDTINKLNIDTINNKIKRAIMK
jgi:tRNA nucleotidyltransferase (CCA-adding enzyme)